METPFTLTFHQTFGGFEATGRVIERGKWDGLPTKVYVPPRRWTLEYIRGGVVV